MDIGTAKPNLEELKKVKHHLIDILHPQEMYSAGKFINDCNKAIKEILLKNKKPLLVGGTGFYINAFFDGLNAPKSDPNIVKEIELRIENEGYENVYNEYLKIDPDSAKRHDKNNYVKTIRGLSCFYTNGEKYSSFLNKNNVNNEFTPNYIGLDLDRIKLYNLINNRVDLMYEQGLLNEVETLLKSGVKPNDYGMRTVGYKEAIMYLNSNLNHEQMIEFTKQSTRRYAKRQITFFKSNKNINWFKNEEYNEIKKLLSYKNNTFFK